MMYQLVDNYAAKTNLAVKSIVVCQCKFDEGDVRMTLSRCSSHSLPHSPSKIIIFSTGFVYLGVQERLSSG